MELYVHLPFCRSKCRYCDFPSFAGCEVFMPAYVDAVLREAAQRAEQLSHPEMQTVFFGGGTPSLLPPDQLTRLLRGLKALFPAAPDAEWTAEANPGTLTEAWLRAALEGGVNRLSLGLQAAQEPLLRMLGRIHTARDAEASVRMARQAGLKNLSLDLMFGLPGQTRRDWLDTLGFALSLRPEHLSCYGLIVEPGTPMEADVAAGSLALPGEEDERAMYDDAIRVLAEHGFRQYEISNFALPGRECRHNIGYWTHVPYLGLGSSAASMLPADAPGFVWRRESNPPALADYQRMTEDGSPGRETEAVDPAEARFETMMLGLRMTDGVAEADFLREHGISVDEAYGEKLKSLAGRGLLRHEDGRWRLTRRGMDVQNAVLVELMD